MSEQVICGLINYYLSDINVYAVVTKIAILNKSFLYNLLTKTSSMNQELKKTIFHNSFKLANMSDELSIILCKNIVGSAF